MTASYICLKSNVSLILTKVLGTPVQGGKINNTHFNIARNLCKYIKIPQTQRSIHTCNDNALEQVRSTSEVIPLISWCALIQAWYHLFLMVSDIRSDLNFRRGLLINFLITMLFCVLILDTWNLYHKNCMLIIFSPLAVCFMWNKINNYFQYFLYSCV